MVDRLRFASVKKAAEYVSETGGISLEAATARLRHNRIDVKRLRNQVRVWSRAQFIMLEPHCPWGSESKSKGICSRRSIAPALARFYSLLPGRKASTSTRDGLYTTR